jgi:hypothetical protein
MKTYQIELIGTVNGIDIRDVMTVQFKGRLKFPHEVPEPIKSIAERHVSTGWDSADISLVGLLTFDRNGIIQHATSSVLITYDRKSKEWQTV